MIAPIDVRGLQDSYRSPPVQRSTSTTPTSVFQYDNKTDLEVNNTGYLMTLLMLGEDTGTGYRTFHNFTTFDRHAWSSSIWSVGSRLQRQKKKIFRKSGGEEIIVQQVPVSSNLNILQEIVKAVEGILQSILQSHAKY